MPEKIELSTNVVNAVLNYLGSRPFQEVAQLIGAIQQEAAPQIPPQEAAESVEE